MMNEGNNPLGWSSALTLNSHLTGITHSNLSDFLPKNSGFQMHIFCCFLSLSHLLFHLSLFFFSISLSFLLSLSNNRRRVSISFFLQFVSIPSCVPLSLSISHPSFSQLRLTVSHFNYLSHLLYLSLCVCFVSPFMLQSTVPFVFILTIRL